MSTVRVILVVVLAVVSVLAESCGGGAVETTTSAGPSTSTSQGAGPVIDPGDGGAYSPDIDPARFQTQVDNPYLPFPPGAHWVYEGTTEDGETERNEVTVTSDRRMIMGVETIVVHDVVSVDGDVVEDTYDWYAQDLDGNVWYFGEDSTSYDEGSVSKAGSWEAGVDGAVPGILMPAHPTVGFAYREEFFLGEAEDMAQIVELGATVETPYGPFDGLLVTINWTPLDPEFIERKYYASGIGFVYETFDRGPHEIVALIEFTPGR